MPPRHTHVCVCDMYGVQDFVCRVCVESVHVESVCGIVNVMFLCVFEKVNMGEASMPSVVHV